MAAEKVESKPKIKKTTVNQYLQKWERLKQKRSLWFPVWELVARYVHTKKLSFYTKESQPSDYFNPDLYDSTAPKALKKMVATLMGMLWPNGGKSKKFVAPEGMQNKLQEVDDYFTWADQQITEALDDPRAGVTLAFEEYLHEVCSFGTGGVFSEKGTKSILSHVALGVDECCIDEDHNGIVDTVYRDFKLSIDNAIKKYGLENLSKKTQEKYAKNQCTEDLHFLHVIEIRLDFDPNKRGNKNMPMKSIHIEIDAKHLIDEKGFEEMPAPFGRFYKTRGETYGQAPGTDCLPDAMNINDVRLDQAIMREKRRDPPLGMYSDGGLGGGQLDTSAKAMNVFNPTGQLGDRKPVFELFTVGDPNAATDEIEDLKASIDDHFSLDRLLDFANKTTMTLGEAQIRERMRGESMGSFFTRQYTEVYTPTLERDVAIMFRNGYLGVIKGSPQEAVLRAQGREIKYIPDQVAELIASGKEFYKIKYETPAARIMEAEEANGIMQTWEFAGALAKGGMTSVLRILDPEESVRIVGRNRGAPQSIFRSKDTVKKMMDAEAANLQKTDQDQEAAVQNELRKGNAEAVAAEATAAKIAEQ